MHEKLSAKSVASSRWKWITEPLTPTQPTHRNWLTVWHQSSNLDGERSLSLSSSGKNRERPITVPGKCAAQKLSKKNSKEHDRGKLTDSKNGKTNLRFAGRVRANNKSERNRNVQTLASSNTAARQAASSSSSSGHDIPTTPKLTSERHSAPSAENTWI